MLKTLTQICWHITNFADYKMDTLHEVLHVSLCMDVRGLEVPSQLHNHIEEFSVMMPCPFRQARDIPPIPRSMTLYTHHWCHSQRSKYKFICYEYTSSPTLFKKIISYIFFSILLLYWKINYPSAFWGTGRRKIFLSCIFSPTNIKEIKYARIQNSATFPKYFIFLGHWLIVLYVCTELQMLITSGSAL